MAAPRKFIGSQCSAWGNEVHSYDNFLGRRRTKRFGSATIFRFVSDTRSAKRYFVSGMVQGVGFRYFTQDVAERLKISGFGRNLRDGRVEVFAMGMSEQHHELRRLLVLPLLP